MTTEQSIQKTSTSIRKLVMGVIITEYALRELKEDSKFDLKSRANTAIKAALSVQNYFRFHPDCSKEHKAIFEKEFIKSELYMLSELMETVWGMSDADLEIIIDSIKQNTTAVEG